MCEDSVCLSSLSPWLRQSLYDCCNLLKQPGAAEIVDGSIAGDLLLPLMDVDLRLHVKELAVNRRGWVAADWQLVNEYSHIVGRGVVLPPVFIASPDGQLMDGFHRCSAMLLNCQSSVKAVPVSSVLKLLSKLVE